MQNDLTFYKNQFKRELQPIIQLLEFKRGNLNFSDWVKFLEVTKASIIHNPEQYLGQELPSSKTIKQSINEIFDEMYVIA